MTRRYFELEDDLYIKGRWHLRRLRDDMGTEYDSRQFTYGNHIDPGPPLKCSLWNDEKVIEVTPPLRLDWSREDKPLDLTYTDSCMPVATKRIAEILEAIAGKDIQRFPVRVDRMDEDYDIINVVAVIDCLDTARSDITWFEEGNDVRPDLAGKPWTVSPLFVDSARIGNQNIFRIKDYTSPVIVSEAIKQALEEAGVTGVRFVSVT
jgi:hypothetical protein